jgi:N-ethylmaleimide reductase
VENRVRFLSEVTEAVTRAWSSDHVGVRLSPTNPYNDMSDSDPLKTFTYATHELNKYNLAYLHVLEGASRDQSAEAITPYLRRLYKGTMIINGGYDKETATPARRSSPIPTWSNVTVRIIRSTRSSPTGYITGAPRDILTIQR